MTDHNLSVVAADAPQLPAPVARRGIDEPTWRTLLNSVYPGARSESVLMAVDYCKARGLDVLKKPVHIVPMKVRDANGGEVWRDVVMPGIYELRSTAFRTGEYVGQDEPEFGPISEHWGVPAPEWCRVRVYRLVQGERVAWAGFVLFAEAAATVSKNNGTRLNAMWSRRPFGQLAKCAEADALRKAFPDELGGVLSADEMEGRELAAAESVAAPAAPARATAVERLRTIAATRTDATVAVNGVQATGDAADMSDGGREIGEGE